jgi:hypothetical protein
MMNWINENKEWIFRGVGVVIITFILNYFFKDKSTSQKQKSGKKSNNYQSGKDITINNKK